VAGRRQRLLFLGSSCIYPRDCPQPIKEDYLLTGPLEPTNEPYAIAKIAGIKLCESYNRQYGTQYRSRCRPTSTARTTTTTWPTATSCRR
jgi:GDP-L-fucose synthase